eukprot:PITA_02112
MIVLNACSRAKSVRRVVYTSSIAAACPLNEEGEFLSGCSLDESRWTPVDFMRRKHQHPLGFYFVAKTLAEQAAIEYGSKSEMEVVTIAPSTVCGPCITSTFLLSCGVPIGMADLGNSEHPQSLLGSISLVHIEDVCEAHIFLMEQPHVEGRHICSAFSLTVSELADIIHKLHPEFSLPFKGSDEENGSVYVPTSSKKLLDMGFSYKYCLHQHMH